MAQHGKQKSWTERTGRDAGGAGATDDLAAHIKKQGFYRPRTSLGGAWAIAGHWVGLAGTMAPIVIGELITDPAKRWRATRLAAVGTAVAYELLYTLREATRRKEQDAKLADCESRAV